MQEKKKIQNEKRVSGGLEKRCAFAAVLQERISPPTCPEGQLQMELGPRSFPTRWDGARLVLTLGRAGGCGVGGWV